MHYTNGTMRMDQMVAYLSGDKINLSPVFQRGHVWKLPSRRKLVRNIVMGRPIPAIFIYKEQSGPKVFYNILDGKQRLESLILFMTDQRTDLSIPGWAKFFSDPKDRKDARFYIELPEGKRAYEDLTDAQIAQLTEYSIPTIEISLTESTSLDEIIDLFVDINQEGEPVKRFDVVKAIGRENELLQSVFDMIAREERRAQDVRYKVKNNEFTSVLGKLSLIANAPDGNARVDRIWERLLELVSFVRHGKHRQPADILKSFIRTRAIQKDPDSPDDDRVSKKEMIELRKIFRLLRKAYKAGLSETPLATDQPHFYTLFTSLVSSTLMEDYDSDDLTDRLVITGRSLAKPPTRGKLAPYFEHYLEISQKQTTHPSRREERQKLLTKLIVGNPVPADIGL